MLYHSKGRQFCICYTTTDSGPLFPNDGRERERKSEVEKQNKMEWNSVAKIINENSMKHATHSIKCHTNLIIEIWTFIYMSKQNRISMKTIRPLTFMSPPHSPYLFLVFNFVCHPVIIINTISHIHTCFILNVDNIDFFFRKTTLMVFTSKCEYHRI